MPDTINKHIGQSGLIEGFTEKQSIVASLYIQSHHKSHVDQLSPD